MSVPPKRFDRLYLRFAAYYCCLACYLVVERVENCRVRVGSGLGAGNYPKFEAGYRVSAGNKRVLIFSENMRK